MEDEILGRLALKKGLVRPDQLQACRKNGSDRPLGPRLVEDKYLTPAQYLQLQNEARELAPFARQSKAPPEKRIGQILMEMGVLVRAQLDEALTDQRRALQGGRNIRIGEVLQEKGYVTSDQLIGALGKQDKKVMSCTGCGTAINVKRYRQGESRMCHNCGAPLKESRGTSRVDHSEIRIQTASTGEIPPHIREITERPMVQFGKYIIVKEILKGSFGTIFHGWKKDEKKSVGVIFLENKGIQDSSATFILVQRELLAKGFPSPELLEVGKYGGRNYMSVSLEE